MRKLLTTTTLALVLLAGCGKANQAQEGSLTTSRSSSPGATQKAAGATSGPTSKAAGGSASATEQPSAGGGSSQTVVKAAPPGTQNRPKDGSYVYTLKGKATDPFNPTGPQRDLNGTQTHKISHSGDVYTSEVSSSESGGTTTLKTKWTSSQVLLVSQRTESPGGTFYCDYSPPLVIAKFPAKIETFPTQHLKGSGNACDGTLDIAFEKKEPATDATGRSWSTWRVGVKLSLRSGQYTIKSDETRWVAPDLGVEVRTNGHQDVTFGAQHFKSDTNTALKSRP